MILRFYREFLRVSDLDYCHGEVMGWETCFCHPYYVGVDGQLVNKMADLSQATAATLDEVRRAFALDDASPERRVNGVWYTGK